MKIVTSLDFSDKVVKASYPNIVLGEVNDTTPLVMTLLQSGDVPLIGKYKGVCKVIGKVALSARNIQRLLRTHNSLVLNMKENGKGACITTVEEYMEVVTWT